MRRFPLLPLLWAGSLALGGTAEWTPFVIPLETHPDSEIAIRDRTPIPVHGPRLIAREGHFYREGRRVRIWGVNLSFGANFPTHADAEKVAERLAAVGLNSVRFHHMDTARWPRGIWDAADPTTLSHEALDRLDYFIDQLAGRGIYANLNLHVGRAHSRYLDVPPSEHNYDKVYNLFAPALVAAQRDYARALLTRVNAYRRVRYADDPAVAFIEITNENSFFMWDGDQTLRSLRPDYATLLQGQYNDWLARRYGVLQALAAAWSKGTRTLGDDLIRNGRVEAAAGAWPEDWTLEQHGDCRATLSHTARGARIEIHQHDQTAWHLQFNQRNLPVEGGTYYTAIFAARSDAPRSLTCAVGQAHDPWRNLGLSRRVELGPAWRTYRLGFVATADDSNARLNFSFGGDATAFELTDLQLRSGGQAGLSDAESWDSGSIALFAENESEQRQQDRMVFLAQTEKAYFEGMRRFLRHTLGCDALVTGTVVFGPLGLYAQSGMDYVDGHAYWQHPHFPGRPWDAGNWQVEQTPMVDVPQEATLFRLAAERLQGKPYTVSEYNHPAPLDSQAACIPMMASFAAAQDWDGIWFYAYSHSNDAWDRGHFDSYFDMDSNPAKWAFMRAGSVLFREGGLGPLGHRAVVSLCEVSSVDLEALARLHRQFGRDLFAALAHAYSMGPSNLLETQLSASLAGTTTVTPVLGTDTEMTWFVEEGRGFYAAAGRSSLVAVGHAQHFERGTGSRIKVTAPNFLSLVVTALDGKKLQASERILVTACGRCENSGMVFSENRATVGRQWGRAPVRVQPVDATLALADGAWQAWALTPDGRRKEAARVVTVAKGCNLVLSTAHGTMWYLLLR